MPLKPGPAKAIVLQPYLPWGFLAPQGHYCLRTGQETGRSMRGRVCPRSPDAANTRAYPAANKARIRSAQRLLRNPVRWMPRELADPLEPPAGEIQSNRTEISPDGDLARLQRVSRLGGSYEGFPFTCTPNLAFSSASPRLARPAIHGSLVHQWSRGVCRKERLPQPALLPHPHPCGRSGSEASHATLLFNAPVRPHSPMRWLRSAAVTAYRCCRPCSAG